jgi:hypothetical protein
MCSMIKVCHTISFSLIFLNVKFLFTTCSLTVLPGFILPILTFFLSPRPRCFRSSFKMLRFLLVFVESEQNLDHHFYQLFLISFLFDPPSLPGVYGDLPTFFVSLVFSYSDFVPDGPTQVSRALIFFEFLFHDKHLALELLHGSPALTNH